LLLLRTLIYLLLHRHRLLLGLRLFPQPPPASLSILANDRIPILAQWRLSSQLRERPSCGSSLCLCSSTWYELSVSSAAVALARRLTNAFPQLSFTFILPLFPKLLEFYRDREAPTLIENGPPTLLQQLLSGLNRYKTAFSRPIDSRYDIVLLGGAMGSLFS
jgi:hypothetical protein